MGGIHRKAIRAGRGEDDVLKLEVARPQLVPDRSEDVVIEPTQQFGNLVTFGNFGGGEGAPLEFFEKVLGAFGFVTPIGSTRRDQNDEAERDSSEERPRTTPLR